MKPIRGQYSISSIGMSRSTTVHERGYLLARDGCGNIVEHREDTRVSDSLAVTYTPRRVYEDSTLSIVHERKNILNGALLWWEHEEFFEIKRESFAIKEYLKLIKIRSVFEERVNSIGAPLIPEVQNHVRRLCGCVKSLDIKDVYADYATRLQAVTLELCLSDGLEIQLRTECKINDNIVSFTILDQGVYVYSGQDFVETFGKNLSKFISSRGRLAIEDKKPVKQIPQKTASKKRIQREYQYQPAHQFWSAVHSNTPKSHTYADARVQEWFGFSR